jgi:hypothetical protein
LPSSLSGSSRPSQARSRLPRAMPVERGILAELRSESRALVAPLHHRVYGAEPVVPQTNDCEVLGRERSRRVPPPPVERLLSQSSGITPTQEPKSHLAELASGSIQFTDTEICS